MYNYYQPTQTYAYVNGIEGAKSYQIMPNQSVLLMDSNAPMFYFKTSNSMGQCAIKTYEFKEVVETLTQSVDTSKFALKSDIEDIKKLIEEMKSNG